MLHHNHHRQRKVSEDCAEKETEDDIACTFGLSSENEERKRKSKVVATEKRKNYRAIFLHCLFLLRIYLPELYK